MVKKKRVPIVFEDDAVIVCEKPAGILGTERSYKRYGCAYNTKASYF